VNVEKPKVIFFDLGNVMVKLRTQEFLDSASALCRPGVTPEHVLNALRDADSEHLRYERGLISGQEFHRHLQEKFGLSADYEGWLRIWNAYFIPNRPMEALLARLQGQARFFALTNTNAEHFRHLKMNFRWIDEFDGIVASHELGLRKPEPEIYLKALEMAGVSAGQALYIDDVAAFTGTAATMGFQVFNYAFNDDELKKFLLELGFDLPALSGHSILSC
jgi:HAD superfamily hydrolase (TIGR01509 family)